jgi:aspartate racemase
MKIAGLIGGIGPESTILYYRIIVTAFRKRKPDGSYPRILINSIDLNTMVRFMNAGDLGGLADFLLPEIDKLARAGADFGALAANSCHMAFDQISQRSPIPLISIVETACDSAQQLKLKMVGLFGAGFTMKAQFYADVFSKRGIRIVVPDTTDQEFIHDRYMNELVNGIVLTETRESLVKIADRMMERDKIEGLLLAGTELSLILGDPVNIGIPILDTTKIHAERIVDRMLEDSPQRPEGHKGHETNRKKDQ